MHAASSSRLARRLASLPALGVAGIALLSACALFSTGTSGLQTNACGFQGATSACGECVIGNCLGVLNACCDDGVCSNSLGYLDGCASGDAVSCTVLRSGGTFLGGATFGALGACVVAHCAACAGSDVTVTTGFDASIFTFDASPPKPGVTCSSVDGSCFCTFETSPTPSTTTCLATAYPDGICCADPNYPAAGSCTCSPFTCNVSSSGDCECSSEYDPSSSKPPSVCTVGCCAATDGLCSCSAGNTCDPSFETAVAECLPDNTGCAGSQVRVPACSQ